MIVVRNVWLVVLLGLVCACRDEAQAPRPAGSVVDPYEFANAVKAAEPVTPVAPPPPVGTPPSDPREAKLCAHLRAKLAERATAHLRAAEGARFGEAEAHERDIAEMNALADELTDGTHAAKRALARRLVAACAPELFAELEKAEVSADRVRVPADRGDAWPW